MSDTIQSDFTQTGNIIIPVLQRKKKTEHQEAERLDQGHATGKSK